MIEIAGIRTESLGDGIGIRTVIFLQTCYHNCLNCQNPDTHNEGDGKQVTLQYLLNVIDNDILATGVTLSGGCPMCNVTEEIVELVKEIKKRNKDIWIYCGEQLEELKNNQLELLQYADVLVDGEYEEELKNLELPFRGSSNQRILYKNIDY